MVIEVYNDLSQEEARWGIRKNRMVSRAKVDFDLIVPLVEDYYDVRRPTGERIIRSWDLKNYRGDRYLVFLNEFRLECLRNLGCKVRMIE